MGGNGTLFGNQLLCVVINISWICAVMVPFFFALNYMGWLRASSADEVEGLDSIYHGGKRSESFDEERRASPELRRYGEGNRRIRRHIRQQSNGCSGRNALIRQQCSSCTARTSTAEGEEQIQQKYPQDIPAGSIRTETAEGEEQIQQKYPQDIPVGSSGTEWSGGEYK